jgi:hypothetical protein
MGIVLNDIDAISRAYVLLRFMAQGTRRVVHGNDRFRLAGDE